MSISYLRPINFPATLEDSVAVSGTNIFVVNSADWFYYNVATGVQLASGATTNSSNRSCCLVNTSSAAVWSNTTNVDIVQLSSGFLHNYSSVAAAPYTQTGQQSVGDPTNSIAVAIEQAAAGKLSVFNGTTFTGSTITISYLSTLAVNTTCVTLRTAGRFLVGTNGGQVVEVDSAGVLYKTIQLPQQPNANYVLSQTPVVCGLSYDGNDFLAITTTAGYVYVYAYASGMLLYVFPFGAKDGTTTNGTPLCTASSGTTILSQNYGISTNNIIGEFDFTTCPATVRDILFTASTGIIYGCGILNTYGWVLQGNTLQSFVITSRNASTQSVTLQNPSGTDVSGRVIRIVDPNVGAPGAYVDCDTVIAAQATTLPVVAGQSVLEVGVINSGTDTLSDIRRFSS